MEEQSLGEGCSEDNIDGLDDKEDEYEAAGDDECSSGDHDELSDEYEGLGLAEVTMLDAQLELDILLETTEREKTGEKIT